MKPIKLYWRSNCAQCQRMLDFFEEKGIPIEAIDVTYDKEQFAEMLRLGGIATPLLVMGQQVFHFFDRNKINRALEELV
ncbi:glutaredoxin domain-containing protein [Paenibacillus sp. PL2-23]|uniref:glutaredoxin family protein n=1 Tax=Paenibacillus sp. PL2-23 TaxID=2100729 RepID=UPI0030F7210A